MGDSDEEYEKRRSRDKFRRERDSNSHERSGDSYYNNNNNNNQHKMNPYNNGPGDRRDNNSNNNSGYYRPNNRSPPNRHYGGGSHHGGPPYNGGRYGQQQHHHSGPGGGGGGDMMYEARKRHNEMFNDGPNKKFRRNWIDVDNPDFNNYYQHDTRDDYDGGRYRQPPMMPYDQRMPPMMQQHQYRQPFNGPPGGYYREPSFPGGNFNNNASQTPQTQMMNRPFDIISSMFETQPPMLSFKAFLSNLSQNLTPEQAAKRYNEYKNSFRREQIETFFDVHKEEEWFKSRYHPDESVKRKEEYRSAIKRRLDIFMDLVNKGCLENVYCDMDHNEALKKFLRAVVIKLEDGTDEEIKILEAAEAEAAASVVVVEEKKDEVEVKVSKSDTNVNDEEDAADYDKEDAVVAANEGGAGGGSDNESGMCSDSDQNQSSGEDSDGESRKKKRRRVKKEKTNGNEKKEGEKEKIQQEIPVKKQPTIEIPKRVQSIFFKTLPVSATRQDLEDIGKKYPGFRRVAVSEPAPERGFQRRAWLTFDLNVDIRDICSKINLTKLNGYNLNATVNREIDEKIRTVNSITNHKNVLRNDIRLISKIISNMDKRWSLWEFEEDDVKKKKTKSGKKKAKKIDKIVDDESEPSVDKSDETDGEEEEEDEDVEMKDIQLKTEKQKNPFLLNINSYLVEETNAEEEELLNGKTSDVEAATAAAAVVQGEEEEEEERQPAQEGEETEIEQKKEIENTSTTTTKKSDTDTIKYETDLELAGVLDRLILYLRIVHSIDFYNITEYQQEDWMPNRLGILHAREKLALDKKIKKSEIEDWIKQFETNIKGYVEYKERIDIEMAKRLGLKDQEIEVDKFMNENCKELEKDKWLCPLSGKKFKAKEYVEKHILSKHGDKLDNVKKLCEYFNNFVYDPKRPYLPEHPMTRFNNSGNDQQQQQQQQSPMPQQQPFFHNQRYPSQPQYQGGGGGGALLPSPMQYQNNRPNFNYYNQQQQQQQQNFSSYRPNHNMPPHHSMRFKKF